PATSLSLAGGGEIQYLNLNPPHFHLLILPFARLPLDQAGLVWMGLSVFALIVSILLIAHELGIVWSPFRALATTCATLAFAGTQAFFLTGQISTLLLLAMTAAWIAARRGRWMSASVWIGGCLSVKPFLLIVLPYLAAKRGVGAAALAVIVAAS